MTSGCFGNPGWAREPFWARGTNLIHRKRDILFRSLYFLAKVGMILPLHEHDGQAKEQNTHMESDIRSNGSGFSTCTQIT